MKNNNNAQTADTAAARNIKFGAYAEHIGTTYLNRLNTAADGNKTSTGAIHLMTLLQNGAEFVEAMKESYKYGVERVDAFHIFSQDESLGYRFKVTTSADKNKTSLIEVSRVLAEPAKDGKTAVYSYYVGLVSKLDFAFSLDSASIVTLTAQLNRAKENSAKSGKPLSARMELVKALIDTDTAAQKAI